MPAIYSTIYSKSFTYAAKWPALLLDAEVDLEPHLLPGRIDIDLQYPLVFVALGDGVGWDGLALYSNHKVSFYRQLLEM